MRCSITDESLAADSEPFKRQRKWNSESLKVPELQGSNSISTSTPRDSFSSVPKRNFLRSDSTISEDAPKERVGELLMFSLLNLEKYLSRWIFSYNHILLQFHHRLSLQQIPSELIVFCVLLP